MGGGLLAEHTCERGMTEKSAVVEHVWENHHPIHWEETSAGPWQRTGAAGERGLADPDDTLEWSTSTEMEDWKLVAGPL